MPNNRGAKRIFPSRVYVEGHIGWNRELGNSRAAIRQLVDSLKSTTASPPSLLVVPSKDLMLRYRSSLTDADTALHSERSCPPAVGCRKTCVANGPEWNRAWRYIV